MIRTPFFGRPSLGFRYTHDVLWHGRLVGSATEVSMLKPDSKYSWHAFVVFFRSPAAAEATSDDDIEPSALITWMGRPGPRPFMECALAAQDVLIRGQNKGGAFALEPKTHPPIIPHVDVPDDQELAERKRESPDIVAW